MQQSTTPNNQFVVDLLTTLRKERFSIIGWWRFLARSWHMSCATANANPLLKRSWARTTLFMALLTVGILGSTLAFEGRGATLRLLPGLLFCIIWQQSDLFWHLGLIRSPSNSTLFQKVGIATTLTSLRGLCVAFLLSRLVGGLPTSSALALSVFLIGVATDILDGFVARSTHTQSKWGQIMDGETDFCLYLVIALILIQNSILPLWLGLVWTLRFCIPLVAGLGSYFLFAHPIRFGSTIWGKCAGLAQCLYFLVLLAPPQFTFIMRIVNLPLLLITLVLLIAAPTAQILANIRPTD